MAQVRVWESMGAYLADLAHYQWGGSRQETFEPSWYGDCSYERAERLAREGDESLVSIASDALSKVRDIVETAPRRGWARGIQGARLDIPAYLAGSPACFRRRIKRDRDVRHVRIFVDCGCSSGIPAKVMWKRGAMVLGLVEALQASQVRVEAYVTSDGKACGGRFSSQLVCNAIKLDETVNLSLHGFALAHPAMGRRLMYSGTQKHYGVNDGISYPITGASEIAAVRAAYGMSDDDVYVPAVSFSDQLAREPEQWLRERISQLTGSEGDRV